MFFKDGINVEFDDNFFVSSELCGLRLFDCERNGINGWEQVDVFGVEGGGVGIVGDVVVKDYIESVMSGSKFEFVRDCIGIVFDEGEFFGGVDFFLLVFKVV